jgi:hypothetical protein
MSAKNCNTHHQKFVLLMAVASPYQRPDSIVMSRLSFPASFLES